MSSIMINDFDIELFYDFIKILDNEQYEKMFENIITYRMIINSNEYFTNKQFLLNIERLFVNIYNYQLYCIDIKLYCYNNITHRIIFPNGLEGTYNSSNHINPFKLNFSDIGFLNLDIKEYGLNYNNMIPFMKIEDTHKYVEKEIINQHKYNLLKDKFTEHNINNYIEQLNDEQFIVFINNYIFNRLNSFDTEDFYTKYVDIINCNLLIKSYKKQNKINAYNFYNKICIEKLYGRRIRLENGIEAVIKTSSSNSKDMNNEHLTVIVYNSNGNNLILGGNGRRCDWDDFVVLNSTNEMIKNKVKAFFEKK